MADLITKKVNTSKKSDDWLPCPFCGSADIRSTRHVGAGSGLHHRGEDVYTMCCYNCGATFPGRYRLELLREAWNRRPTIETCEPLRPPQRYRVQQDKGEYALKGCADGDLVDYSAYEALLRRFNQPPAQKANSCVCGEPNSPGTHRTDGPCLAPIGDHHR